MNHYQIAWFLHPILLSLATVCLSLTIIAVAFIIILRVRTITIQRNGGNPGEWGFSSGDTSFSIAMTLVIGCFLTAAFAADILSRSKEQAAVSQAFISHSPIKITADPNGGDYFTIQLQADRFVTNNILGQPVVVKSLGERVYFKQAYLKETELWLKHAQPELAAHSSQLFLTQRNRLRSNQSTKIWKP